MTMDLFDIEDCDDSSAMQHVVEAETDRGSPEISGLVSTVRDLLAIGGKPLPHLCQTFTSATVAHSI